MWGDRPGNPGGVPTNSWPVGPTSKQMNVPASVRPQTKRYSPLGQLILARLREFFRQPEVVFWVYGFPILMVVALGIAFRNRPIERSVVAVEDGAYAQTTADALSANKK